MANVLVKWKRFGYLFSNGIAYKRSAGEEDVMTERQASNYVAADYVTVVAPIESVASITHVIAVSEEE